MARPQSHPAAPEGFIRHVPNLLSLSRVPFLFVTSIFLLTDAKYKGSISLILYTIAAITDWLDGSVARKYHVVSVYGIFIDALADKVLNIGIFIVLLMINAIPRVAVFIVLASLAREFLVTGLRLVAASCNVVIPAGKGGKTKTASQMVAVVLLLLAMSLGELGLAPLARAADLLGQGLFWISNVLAVTSGISYYRKHSSLILAQKPDVREEAPRQ